MADPGSAVRIADFLCLGLIALLLSLEHFVVWPAFLRRSRAARGGARLWLWSRWMLVLWTLAGAVVALWLFEARDWDELRLVVPRGWRLWGAIALLSVFAISYGRPVLRILRSRRPRRMKIGNVEVERIVPRTRAELGCWLALSLSAGICEELVFRGYLIWAFQPKLGSWGAAGVSLAVFAAAHAYQGAQGVVAVAIVGALLTAVVLVFDSLLPAMALHTLIDVIQGILGWLVLRDASADVETR